MLGKLFHSFDNRLAENERRELVAQNFLDSLNLWPRAALVLSTNKYECSLAIPKHLKVFKC